MARALDWEAIRDYYDAGHTKSECRDRFGISDWDWHAAVGRGDLIPRVKGNQVGSSDKRALIGRLRSRGLSYSQICRRLGISKATVAYHVRRMGVEADDTCARRYDWNQIQKAIDEGSSVRECMARFGFTSSSWGKAVKRGAITPREWITPIEELLVRGRRRGRGHLKNRLVKAGLKENRCERCGITEWMGESIKYGVAPHKWRRIGQPPREPPAPLRQLPFANGQLGRAGEAQRRSRRLGRIRRRLVPT
jgi:hypothetical protein